MIQAVNSIKMQSTIALISVPMLYFWRKKNNKINSYMKNLLTIDIIYMIKKLYHNTLLHLKLSEYLEMWKTCTVAPSVDSFSKLFSTINGILTEYSM